MSGMTGPDAAVKFCGTSGQQVVRLRDYRDSASIARAGHIVAVLVGFLWGQELEPIAIVVPNIEPTHARKVLVPFHSKIETFDSAGQGVDIAHKGPRMGFLLGSEVLLGASMDFKIVGPNPKTATCRQHLWFLNLRTTQDVDIEFSTLILSTFGEC